MSTARHHAEWLSLVPVSGPFLSLPVLLKAFPQGLDAHESEHAQTLRMMFENWDDATNAEKRTKGRGPGPDPNAAQNGWIRFVLTHTLEFDENLLLEGPAIPQTLQAEMPEHHEWLRPNIVLNDPSTNKPRLLIQTYPRSQNLNSYVAGSRWKASPDTRMTELLHATGVRLGLVTNGEHWMLVDAPKGDTSGYSSWYASLWLEEKITLQAFRSLLSQTRFFGVADDQTIEALLTESSSNQQEVTDRLGLQVRRAVEVLIHSLDKADQDFDRALLADVPESVLYESALTVMMRLVFLFCAEERELIPSKPFPVYERNYSVSAIINQLEDLAQQHGEELLERRNDAWSRLLTAFRVVYGGLQHEDVYIPAYGGKLFNPDRFPFLEGRAAGTTWREHEAKPLPVNNRTVLHLLKSLQYLEMKASNSGGAVERRRLSFRALDIEQIGHVYEGLLDHTAKRATEPILGLLGAKNREPEVSLAELQNKCDHETDKIHEKKAFVEYLKDQTGKSESALKNALQDEVDDQQRSRFRTACQTDDLWEEVKPFAKLIRNDTFGYPVVIPAGSVFVTTGTDRRSSGTHYTPRVLTEPIVQYTLEPLVYIGPAEGLPKSEWKLKSAKELLALKICDMACGSGAFLVQACRYLAERLLEAWEEARTANPHSPGITPEGMPSTGRAEESLIPDDPQERKLYAMRLIAQRCLYGVDINPLAVEMCKLSLWLLTMAKDKPFEFLDHNIRCGDSLVGLHNIDQLRHFNLKPDSKEAVLFGGPFEEAVEEAISLRLKLEEMPSNTIEDVRAQEKLLKEADDKIARLKCAADLLVAAEFWGEHAKDQLERIRHAAVKTSYYLENGPTEEFDQVAAKERRGQKMFHWPLEFPEVILKHGGFDAFLGNPPFMGGQIITYAMGKQYRQHIVDTVGNSCKGSADLCSFFVLRACSLLSGGGSVGLITTNTISEGETRKVGLDQIDVYNIIIRSAITSLPWPGTAVLSVSLLWLFRGQWAGALTLDNIEVNVIATSLKSDSHSEHKPFRLQFNKPLAYKGSSIQGIGFLVSPSEASEIIASNSEYRNVLFPYMSGSDVTGTPDSSPSRWAINFFDWTLEQAEAFPTCLNIVRQKVKPQREIAGQRNAIGKRRAEVWWRYDAQARKLYDAISRFERVWVMSETSKYGAVVAAPTNIVFAHKVVVFCTPSYSVFACLTSTIHQFWIRHVGASLKSDIEYSVADVFETFPFPKGVWSDDTLNKNEGLESIGKRFLYMRQMMMKTENIGVTTFYNRFHDLRLSASEIKAIRRQFVEMDQAVAAAYGWTDLDLDHGFHETKQGVRFTISEPARREVLQRLLKLNHERYAEEVKQGLHDKKAAKKRPAANSNAEPDDQETVVPPTKRRAPKKSPKSKSSDPQTIAEERTLFSMEDDE
jgi:hypothetical protein